jgi:hypothetical protein
MDAESSEMDEFKPGIVMFAILGLVYLVFMVADFCTYLRHPMKRSIFDQK